jgi:hypothetical protein
MKNSFFLFSLFALLLTACGAPASAASTARDACPVTLPSKKAFVPPAPWPAASPDAGRYWYGDADLWTALPEDGMWPDPSYGFKFLWWSEAFDVTEDETPDLVIHAVSLDAHTPDGAPLEVRADHATNLYHESVHWAMLEGIHLSPGCWSITGQYKDHELSFVLYVGEGGK